MIDNANDINGNPIAGSFITSLILFSVNILSSFLIIRLLINRLGVTGNGIWVYLVGIVEFLGFFDLGLSTAVTKFTSQFAHEKDPKSYRKKIFQTAFSLYMMIGLTVLFFGTLAMFFLDRFTRIPDGWIIQSRRALGILFLQFSLQLLTNLLSSTLAALKKFAFINLINTLMALLRLVLYIIILKLGLGILALALCALFVSISTWIIFYWKLKSYISWIGFTFSFHLDRDQIRQFFAYGSWTLVGMISYRLFYYTDNLIVGTFVNPVQVTYYYLAWKIVEYVRNISIQASAIFLPMASEMEKDRNAIKRLFFRGMRLNLFLTLGIGSFVLLFAEKILRLWLGFSEPKTVKVLFILLIPQLFNSAFHTGVAMLYGINKHSIQIRIGLGFSILNVAIGLSLVQHLGIIGVALGSGITITLGIIVNLFLYPVLIGISRWDLFREWIKILLCAVASLIPLLIFQPTQLTFPVLVLLLLFFGTTYILLCWFFVFPSEEKSEFLRIFIRKKTCRS